MADYRDLIRGLALLAVFAASFLVHQPSVWEYFVVGLLGGGNIGHWAGRHD